MEKETKSNEILNTIIRMGGDTFNYQIIENDRLIFFNKAHSGVEEVYRSIAQHSNLFMIIEIKDIFKIEYKKIENLVDLDNKGQEVTVHYLTENNKKRSHYIDFEKAGLRELFVEHLLSAKAFILRNRKENLLISLIRLSTPYLILLSLLGSISYRLMFGNFEISIGPDIDFFDRYILNNILLALNWFGPSGLIIIIGIFFSLWIWMIYNQIKNPVILCEYVA
jgi:hypothetical protein